MGTKQHIIINIEHKLIQVCIFKNQGTKRPNPLFFKNYFIRFQRKQTGFAQKLDSILAEISAKFKFDVAAIYLVFYDNHVITKKVTVKVTTHHHNALDRYYFEKTKKSLLVNSIIENNYQSCGFWIASIKQLAAKEPYKTPLIQSKVTILCDFLLKTEYKKIHQLVASDNQPYRKVHLVPATKAIKAYFRHCDITRLKEVFDTDEPYYTVHILDNRIVLYRLVEKEVTIFRSFQFGIIDVINSVSKQCNINRKICVELFFSTSEVFYQFTNLKLLGNNDGKKISIDKIRRLFVCTLYERLLPIFSGEMYQVVVMGRAVESMLFWQFVKQHLSHIKIVSDQTVFLREKNWILFKLIGANYLLNEQDELLR